MLSITPRRRSGGEDSGGCFRRRRRPAAADATPRIATIEISLREIVPVVRSAVRLAAYFGFRGRISSWISCKMVGARIPRTTHVRRECAPCERGHGIVGNWIGSFPPRWDSNASRSLARASGSPRSLPPLCSSISLAIARLLHSERYMQTCGNNFYLVCREINLRDTKLR